MPIKLALSFKTEANLEVSNDLMHAFVFSLFPQEVAEKVHKREEKPFSLRGWNFTERGLLLRISLLEDQLFPALVSHFYLSKNGFRLKDVELQPVVPSGLREEESISYQELLELESYEHYSVDFIKPTTFRRGRWDYPLPDPPALFRSLYKKWKSHHPFPLEEDKLLHRVYSKVYILAHKIRVETVELSFGKLRGFVGNVVFGVNDKEFSRLVHALLKFGEFSGVGRKSAMGMGVMVLRKET